MNMQTAQTAFEKGNLQKADLACRLILSREPGHVDALNLIEQIRSRLDLDLDASCAPPGSGRYLLIKAWGFGFWSDLDHVLGCLLVAELTNRTPFVHWGSNSLFRDPDTDNAFTSFFQPVSQADWSAVCRAGLSYFPDKWHADNLRSEELAKWSGPGSRLTGMYLLGRSEDVVVSDFHTKINDLIPWIPRHSPLHGQPREAIYRYLVGKYLRLSPRLQQSIDALWAQHMAQHNWLAVHVRGTDKIHEMGNLKAVNEAYHDRIERILEVNPSLRIFLLTDSTHIVDQFRHRWGDRVFVLDCQRGQSSTGVHLEGHPGTLLGEQVLTDAYLASRCDFFLGNGGSNVSTGIRHLKDWPKGTFFLIGPDFLGQIDLSLHDW
mgnify:CR=1 FL=1